MEGVKKMPSRTVVEVMLESVTVCTTVPASCFASEGVELGGASEGYNEVKQIQQQRTTLQRQLEYQGRGEKR
jgi:hypothetical protein